MRRTIVTAVAAAVTLGAAISGVAGTTGAGASSGTTTASAGATRTYTPPKIKWGACTNSTLRNAGAQCGYLTVPLDYARPSGAKVQLAVSRVLHKAAGGKYQGVMLVNPGGPGGSGLVYSVLQRSIPKNAGLAYDWIGFDPRGVGASKPSLSCFSKYFRGDRPPYRPTTAAIEASWVTRSKDYAADCRKAPNRILLNHVRTVDSVADMESLRIALGQSQINYYGFSYGTYLGQVYATLHPTRVRRFVFDGTVDPQRVFYQSNLDQDRAFQTTFTAYLTYLAKYSSHFHVGTTLAAVRKTYLDTITKLDKTAAKGVLGGDELTDVFTQAGYYVYGWVDIGNAFSALINDNDPQPLIDMYTDANPTTKGADNSYAMYLATQCTDAPWPRSQSALDADSRAYDKKYDYFTWSNAWFNGPCAYWGVPSHKPVNVTGSKVKVPILMIGETFDAATPFAGSLVVRKLFPTASLIEGKNGTTHAGSLSGVRCTDDSIATYLKKGLAPKRLSGNRSDRVCSPVPQPTPDTAAARTAATTVRPALRHA